MDISVIGLLNSTVQILYRFTLFTYNTDNIDILAMGVPSRYYIYYILAEGLTSRYYRYILAEGLPNRTDTTDILAVGLPSRTHTTDLLAPEVRRREYWRLGVFLLQYFPLVRI